MGVPVENLAVDFAAAAVEAQNNDPRSKIGNRPACFSSTTTEILFVLTATMAIMTSSYVAGTVTVISAYVGDDLHATAAEITWITASSSLAAGSFLLFFGRLADLFGRKWLFVGALLLFAIFALAAGFSDDPITLDVMNGFLGLTSAAAVPPAIGALGATYATPSKRKNYVFACFSAGNPLGFVSTFYIHVLR